MNQNDCRTSDLDALTAHGPVDLHWLQYSGAIWYPMVYDMPDADKRVLCEAKVESQFARAMRYVEAIGARAVVPSAGPPAFLDPELFHLNMITGDELSIFPDQRAFLDRLAAGRPSGRAGDPRHDDRDLAGCDRRHPSDPRRDVEAIFDDKANYLERYRADWMPWLGRLHASWHDADDRPAGDAEGVVGAAAGDGADAAAAVGARLSVPRRRRSRCSSTSRPARCAPYAGEPLLVPLRHRPRSRSRPSWLAGPSTGATRCSCRAASRAWRAGEFNEYLYNFFKSLSVERMRRAEAEALRRLEPPTEVEPDIELGDWIVQRRCPHRHADLAVFGEIEGCELVCTLHGWRFDLETGRCLTADDRSLRVRRRESTIRRAECVTC